MYAKDGGNVLGLEMALGAARSILVGLIDPLGRPIHSWPLEVSAGETQVHLNVADVPSGVYFLRVSAAGMEEVRKVVIVH